MKINFDDTAKMRAALDQANRGRFMDALAIFAQVDTYESALNQIACLCALDEDLYAADLYRQTKQKYGQTHAVYSDVCFFGDLVTTVFDFCEPDRDYALQTDGEISADTNNLLQYAFNYDDDSYYDDEPTESFFSTPIVATSQGFYDVSDPLYVQSLRAQFEDALLYGDEKTVKSLYKRTMLLAGNNLETLELKLALVAVTQKTKGKQALDVAKAFANVDNGSMLCKATALQVVLDNNPHKNVDVLNKLVQKLLLDADKIGAAELAELVYISNDVLRNTEAAFQFAKALYARHDDLMFDDYKVCAAAFFNHGDRDLCRDVMLTLNRFVPFDSYVAFWLEFVQNASYKTPPLQVGGRALRHFYVPYGIFAYVNTAMGQIPFGENMTLTADDYRYVNVQFLYTKSLRLLGENTKYHEMSSVVRALLHALPPQNKQDFFNFAKQNLFTTINDPLLNQTLLALLMELGYADKVFVGLTDTYQVVDFKDIPQGEEQLYLALAIALSVQVAHTPSLVKAYYALKPFVDSQQQMLGLSNAHSLAYAMLCVSNPDFATSETADFFDGSEKQLYATYLNSLTE